MRSNAGKKVAFVTMGFYVRAWAAPIAMLLLFVCGGIALFHFRLQADRTEFADRTMYHAAVNIERVEPLRTTAQKGFRQGRVVTVKIRGQEIEHAVEYDAHPGESVDVDYSVGASGTVYVWGVQPEKYNG
jgi:hypothetical protein